MPRLGRTCPAGGSNAGICERNVLPQTMNTLYIKLVATVAALLIIAAANLGLVDTVGREYTSSGFKRALVTYGIARTLNGVISVAQGTEVAFEPAGVGVTFTPGEILDPVNDLVERFAWVVLASATSLGIQQVLINVTAWIGFSVLVSAVIAIAIGFAWQAGKIHLRLRFFVYRLALVLVVARFAVPVMAICSNTMYVTFLEQQYLEAQDRLNVTTTRIRTITEQEVEPVEPEAALSFLEKTKLAYQSAANAVNVRKRIASLQSAAADISEYAINLIVVFVTETIVFPLLFLWLTIQLAKKIVNTRFEVEQQ